MNRAYGLTSEGRFDMALDSIHALFESFPKVFARDAAVAFRLAAITGHGQSAAFARYTVLSGIKLAYFETCLLAGIDDRDTLWQYIKENYHHWRAAYLSGINAHDNESFSLSYEDEQQAKRSSMYVDIVHKNFESDPAVLQIRRIPG